MASVKIPNSADLLVSERYGLQLRTDTAIKPMTCPSVDVSRAAVMMRRIIMYMQYSIPQNVNVMKN